MFLFLGIEFYHKFINFQIRSVSHINLFFFFRVITNLQSLEEIRIKLNGKRINN